MESFSACKNIIFLTLLKLGAPSVCGASFTSLSMPSKASVIALHVEMSAILMLFFLRTQCILGIIFHREISQMLHNNATLYIFNQIPKVYLKVSTISRKNLSQVRHVNILAHPDQERYVEKKKKN